MPSDRQMLVHVGLHKTGTTWVQQQIFQAGSNEHFRYSEDRTLLRGVWAQPDYGDFDPALARDQIMQGLQGSPDFPVVLSDEILSGLPFHSRFGQGVIMERIAHTFPQAKILITVREQTSLIYSAYGHYLRGGHTASLDNFLATPKDKSALVWRSILDHSYYDYEHLHHLYARKFGAKNVMIAPMEWMIGDTQDFLVVMQKFTGHSWPLPSVTTKNRKVNPAWTDLARTYIRVANRFEDQDARWNKKRKRFSKNAIASKISAATPKGLHERMKAKSLRKIAQAIGDQYAASNRTLSQKTGIDLERYGYVMTPAPAGNTQC